MGSFAVVKDPDFAVFPFWKCNPQAYEEQSQGFQRTKRRGALTAFIIFLCANHGSDNLYPKVQNR
jgi:hypothetical protein